MTIIDAYTADQWYGILKELRKHEDAWNAFADGLDRMLKERVRAQMEKSAARRGVFGDPIDVPKMPVHVVMVNDRHTDPDVELFTDPDAAIDYARKYAEDEASRVDHREVMEQVPLPDGWLYCATYSLEDDSVWVLTKELRNG